MPLGNTWQGRLGPSRKIILRESIRQLGLGIERSLGLWQMRSVTEAERMRAGAELHAKYRRKF